MEQYREIPIFMLEFAQHQIDDWRNAPFTSPEDKEEAEKTIKHTLCRYREKYYSLNVAMDIINYPLCPKNQEREHWEEIITGGVINGK